MQVIKRNGKEVEFDSSKIYTAISKANEEVNGSLHHMNIQHITNEVVFRCEQLHRQVTVEEIQDIVEVEIMREGAYDVARAYIRYRYDREKIREKNTTDGAILTLIECDNEDVKQENSNKNPTLLPTQRDYMAGEVSKDLCHRMLVPKHIMKAHDEGIIHFHDSDYFAQHMHNCDLVNLDDMLQNGTVISGTMIEKPKKFSTACTIATQIIAQVASHQYGGQSISIAHLAKFVDSTRQKFIKKHQNLKETLGEENFNKFIEDLVHDNIVEGVQTLQYQVVTLMTTNGQAPFITFYMNINELPEGQGRDDLVEVIKEVLIQRTQGVKNEKGVWTTVAFPKLIYVLDDNNTYPGSKYYDVTILAAKCTAKRMVPDYISAKKMREFKIDQNGNGQVYTCMGCHAYGTPIVMADGTMKEVQDVKVGDKVMGADGTPRNVLELVRGESEMYRIEQSQADSYVVNRDHILSLVYTSKRPQRGWKEGDIVNIKVDEFLKLPLSYRDCLKGYKGSYDLPERQFKIHPYILGLWLGDGVRTFPIIIVNKKETQLLNDIVAYADSIGHSVTVKEDKENTWKVRIVNPTGQKGNGHTNEFYNALKELDLINNKHIPEEYFLGSYEQRNDLLAGLMNSDGWGRKDRGRDTVCIGSTNFDIIQGAKRIADSLGYRTNTIFARKAQVGTANHQECNLKDYWHLGVTGYRNERLMEHKQPGGKSRRNFHRSKINPIPVGRDKYYGFNLDGDQLYLFNDCTVTHNCRSFLTPYVDEDGNPKYYGRFNQGVVTINLPDVALSSKGDEKEFWRIFDERLQLCYEGLMCRHNRLKGTSSNVAPILWQYGALARLEKGEKIDKLLYGGYSTISLGYAGLYECVKYMKGSSHTQEPGTSFALEIMEHMNAKCREWKAKHNIDFSLYGTPIESTTYKFAKCLQKRFGIIEGITDKNYITNSYHVHVTEEIDAFTKLKFESMFQKLSPGGAISYVEVPDMTTNIESVLTVMQYIYENIMYAELNTKQDYCMECGYEGEVKIVEENGKLVWECPVCGNRDQTKMNIPRRTCGYIGTNGWNQGRTQEIKDRVLHL